MRPGYLSHPKADWPANLPARVSPLVGGGRCAAVLGPVIQPAAHWWDQKAYLKSAGAKPVAEDFQYSSDRNAEWLTRPQLAEILKHEAIEL